MKNFNFRYSGHTFIVSLVALAIAAIFVNAKNVKSPEKVSHVVLKHLKGKVYAYGLDGEQRGLKKGDKVFFGEILRTANESLAVVAVVAGVKMKIDSNSVVEIDNLYEKAKKKRSANVSFPRFFLHRGALYGSVDKDRKDKRVIKVNSSTVSLGVRGTQFFVHIDGENENQYTAHVKRGTVALEKAKQKVVLASNQGAHLTSEGPLTEASNFDWSKDLNYNFDPSKGALATSEKVFGKIQKSYEEYSKRVREKAKSYFDSQKDKFENMKKKR